MSPGCNPVGEDIDEPLWNATHDEKPFHSNFYHSSNYRFPHGACDEPQCHGDALTGGNSGSPSCYSCHDDQWTVFGVSHTKQISGYYHKDSVDDTPADTGSNLNWLSNCKGCHSSDLEGNKTDPGPNAAYRHSCKDCHTEFSGKIPPPGHRKKKGSGWHHYAYERNHATYCSGSACHGADGESQGSNTTSDFSGFAPHGPACSQCHHGGIDDDK